MLLDLVNYFKFLFRHLFLLYVYIYILNKYVNCYYYYICDVLIIE